MDDRRAKELFLDALEQPTGERAAFVQRACGEQESLALAVHGLVAADGRATAQAAGDGTSELPFDGLFVGAPLPELGPGEAVGSYVLRHKLGEGGFGIVWQAEQRAPVRREVALKVLKPGMDTAAVLTRFDAERQALARMEHPGICKVHDAGTTPDGRPYFVMELFDGEPITRYCQERALPLKARLRLFGAVCEAVQHAHHKGVIHRDLKPSNVLVLSIDGRPTPKVIDFGVAKATDQPLSETPSVTREGQFLGTPAYMSPEQASGSADVDMRSDVYALGALLYELLCGQTPFDPHQVPLALTLRRIQEDDPPRPSRALRAADEEDDPKGVRAIPDDLDWVVMRCLEKDRDRRYASAYDLRADLERFLRHQPVEAAPPSSAYRLKKLARRHRVLVATSGAVLLALVIGMIGTLLGLRAARSAGVQLASALTQAEDEADRARAAEASAAQEAREARRQERIAKEVLGFLNDDLLAAVGPSGQPGRGPNASMGEVLDEAARRIERASMTGGRFAQEPLVEAAVRDTLGNTYRLLGRYREAAPHLRRARELRVAELGREDPDSQLSTLQLASALRRSGRVDESEALLEDFVTLACAPIEDLGEEELSALRELGLLRRRQGRLEQAAQLFERALLHARLSRDIGPTVRRTLRNDLAVTLAGLGSWREAEPQFRASYEEALHELGTDDPETLSAAINLSAFLLAREDYGAAADILEPAIKIHERVYGDQHPQTAQARINLGILRRGQGRLFDSADALEQAVSTLTDQMGRAEPATLKATTQLARTLVAMGESEQAESLILGALEDAEESLPEGHPFRSSLRKDLAFVWFDLPGRHDELEALLIEDFEATHRDRGPTHRSTLRAMVNLALVHRRNERLEEAEALLREVFETSRQTLGEEDIDTLLTACDLVLCLALAKKIDEALELAAQTVAIGERTLDPNSEALAIARLRLGSCLLDHERFAEAETPLRRSREVLARQRHAGDDFVHGLAGMLARACEAQGRDEEALVWRAAEAAGED